MKIYRVEVVGEDRPKEIIFFKNIDGLSLNKIDWDFGVEEIELTKIEICDDGEVVLHHYHSTDHITNLRSGDFLGDLPEILEEYFQEFTKKIVKDKK